MPGHRCRHITPDVFDVKHVPDKLIKRLQVIHLVVNDGKYYYIPTPVTMRVVDINNEYTDVKDVPLYELDRDGGTLYVVSVHYDDVYIGHTITSVKNINDAIEYIPSSKVRSRLTRLGLVHIEQE